MDINNIRLSINIRSRNINDFSVTITTEKSFILWILIFIDLLRHSYAYQNKLKGFTCNPYWNDRQYKIADIWVVHAHWMKL